MILLDLEQFSDKLFAVAHVWMLLISACLEDKFEAGMIRYVSSANIHRELSGVCLKITGIDYICSRSNAGALNNTCCDIHESRLSATVDSAMRVTIEEFHQPIKFLP